MADSKIPINFSSYKEIIKSPIIYRCDHSEVRAKEQNGMRVMQINLSDWLIRKSDI